MEDRITELETLLEDYRDADKYLRRENNALRADLSTAKSIIRELYRIGAKVTEGWRVDDERDDS